MMMLSLAFLLVSSFFANVVLNVNADESKLENRQVDQVLYQRKLTKNPSTADLIKSVHTNKLDNTKKDDPITKDIKKKSSSILPAPVATKTPQKLLNTNNGSPLLKLNSKQHYDDYGNGNNQNHNIALRGHHKKKKKVRKAIMKLLLLGTIIKSKVELFLKVLATHLQIKFFFVALAGLLINIARFYIDLKRGQAPQKQVVYYEHAHHQHHYDEHDDGWGNNGGYWRRSLEVNPQGDSTKH